eukprot:139114_1
MSISLFKHLPVPGRLTKSTVDAKYEPTVFVGIASYRDDECHETIESLFEAAQIPDNVFVGAYQQHSENDTNCTDFSTRCHEDQNHPVCSRRHHIKVKNTDWMNAR